MDYEIPKILTNKRKWLLLRLIIIGIAQAGIAIISVLIVRYLFDQISTHPGDVFEHDLLIFSAVIFTLTLFNAWLKMAERVESERMGQDYIYDLRLILYDRLVSLPSRTIQGRGKGGLMLRFIGDLTALRQWISLGVARLTVACVITVCVLVALAMIDWLLAAYTTVVLGIAVITVLYLSPQLEQAAKDVRKRRTYLANNINEKISSIAVVQIFNQHHREQQRIRRQSMRLQNASLERAAIIGKLRGIAEATAAITTFGVLILGCYEVANGATTPGSVVAAMTFIGFLAPSLKDLGRVHEYWKNSTVSVAKIESFLEIPSLVEEADNAEELNVREGQLVFKNVSFNNVLKNFSYTFEAGKVIAIVGPNGAGKSTLLSLATRLIDPDQGSILIDSMDIKKATLASVRDTVGLVSPDLPLLRGTIDKNLRYRWRNAPETEITRIKKLCQIDTMLSDFADGERTRIQDGGKNLSFGQQQRIALARTLLGNPKILLLDEADANLDPKSSKILDNTIAQFSGTVLLVTHRIDRLYKADRIIYLSNGTLVEQGTPEQLLNTESLTRKLFQQGLAS